MVTKNTIRKITIKVKPLRDNIIVHQKAAKTVTDGGIHLPAGAEEKFYEGLVIAVGKDATDIKPADEIIFYQYSGTIISIEDVPCLLISEKDVLARKNV